VSNVDILSEGFFISILGLNETHEVKTIKIKTIDIFFIMHHVIYAGDLILYQKFIK
jgi:hypothetical protein